jgi:arylsulfatase
LLLPITAPAIIQRGRRARRSPSTAYQYDWNVLPIGQQLLALQELESSQKFPPLQNPETYNLTGILDQMKKGAHGRT